MAIFRVYFRFFWYFRLTVTGSDLLSTLHCINRLSIAYDKVWDYIQSLREEVTKLLFSPLKSKRVTVINENRIEYLYCKLYLKGLKLNKSWTEGSINFLVNSKDQSEINPSSIVSPTSSIVFHSLSSSPPFSKWRP